MAARRAQRPDLPVRSLLHPSLAGSFSWDERRIVDTSPLDLQRTRSDLFRELRQLVSQCLVLVIAMDSRHNTNSEGGCTNVFCPGRPLSQLGLRVWGRRQRGNPVGTQGSGDDDESWHELGVRNPPTR